MRILCLILIAATLAGCQTPQQLPKPAKRTYRYVFYGWHRRLTPYEDTRARKLFDDYIAARNKWQKDEDCPCICNYNDLADWDRMIDFECDIYSFVDSIR